MVQSFENICIGFSIRCGLLKLHKSRHMAKEEMLPIV